MNAIIERMLDVTTLCCRKALRQIANVLLFKIESPHPHDRKFKLIDVTTCVAYICLLVAHSGLPFGQ